MHIQYTYVPPDISFPEDILGLMSHNGELMAISQERAVWRFGFVIGSPMAKMCGYGLEEFCWLLTDTTGQILERFDGHGKDLPDSFNRIFIQKIIVKDDPSSMKWIKTSEQLPIESELGTPRLGFIREGKLGVVYYSSYRAEWYDSEYHKLNRPPIYWCDISSPK